MSMEEYIKMLLEQVRFEKAHKAIGDEIRAHIEEQIEANVSDGMDRVTAEEKAVEDMGNPMEVGMSLDRVHRPQVAWGLIIAAMTIGTVGAMIRMTVAYSEYDDFVIATNAFFGISLMLLAFLVDYTTILKYSKLLAAVLIVGMVLNQAIYSHGPEGNFFWRPYSITRVVFTTLFVLFIPLYSGIIYRYRGQAYKGLIKAVLWIVIPCMYMSSRLEGHAALHVMMIALSLLAQLTIAIKKGWFVIPQKKVIASLWAAFAIFPGNLMIELRNCFPSSKLINVRHVMDRLKPLGCWVVYSNLGGKNVAIAASNYFGVATGEHILLYICSDWGWAVGLAVILSVIGLIVFGFIALSKIKNQVGIAMGSGCLIWLTANAVANLLAGFGLFLTTYVGDTFFPFISDSNVIVSYVFLGIILSIYKYKNAYSQHVDIEAQSGVQLKLLNYELDIKLRKEVKEEKKALIKQKMGEIIYDKK